MAGLVSPVLEGWLQQGAGSFRVLGIDILTLTPGGEGTARLTDRTLSDRFISPPWLILAHPDTAEEFDAGGTPVETAAEVPPGTLLMDIALAQQLTGQPDGIATLLVAPAQPPRIADLEAITGTRLLRQPPETGSDLAQLTESFHLNLTAFGLLSFLVGLFIVHATIGLAFEQRRAMIRTMRSCGASLRAVLLALVLELGAFVLVAWILGMGLGYAIAALLLPDVAASLRGLYGAQIDGALSLRPGWWLSGLAMTALGAGIAAAGGLVRVARMPLLASAREKAWILRHRATLKRQGWAGLGLVAFAVALGLSQHSLVAGFAALGVGLAGAALVLPPALAAVLALLARRVTGVRAEWFLADTRAQLPGLSLALMALLLALAINIGVGTMVGSFRQTFIAYLDQRLGADLYLRNRSTEEAAATIARLSDNPAVTAIQPTIRAEIRLQGAPVEVYGSLALPRHREHWPMIETLPQAWDMVSQGEGILVSEQLAHRLDLAPGGTLALSAVEWAPRVVGIYPDYGNPMGQAIVGMDRFKQLWPGVATTRHSVFLAPGADVAAVRDTLIGVGGLGPDQVIDQPRLKAISLGVFERTFAVTLALNSLTFAVAGLALAAALMTLAQARLPQVAPAWALGMTRRQLAGMELARVLLMAALTALLAIPLGVAIAWVLLSWVNVAAFGWRIPLLAFPGQWIALLILAMVTSLIAAAWPSRMLVRLSPAQLLRIFADAR